MSNKIISEVFLKWCQDITLGGVPQIVRSRCRIPSLIYWSIMFSVCLALSIYMVVSLVQEYNEFEVVTTDRLISYDELKFPVVTFCNENPFLSPKANEYLKGYFYEKYGVNVSSNKEILQLLGPDQVKLDMKRALYNLMSQNVSDEMRKSMGYSANETFFTITFFGDNLKASDSIEWFFDPVYGNCYRIKLKSSAYREGLGLSIEAFTGLPYEFNSYMYEPEAKGLRIEIKDADNYPYVYKSILAPASLYNLFTLTKKSSQLLPKPYSKCDSMSLKNLPLVEEMTRQGIPYDRGLCSIFALQNWTLHNYGCHNLLYPRMSYDLLSPPCFNENISTSIRVDANECPLDCDQISYDFFYTEATFPNENWYEISLAQELEYFERIFSHEPSYQAVKSSFATILIVYEKITIEEVSEKPKVEFLDLIANIGGTIGLFLGLSVLTVTEIFELAFMLIARFVSSRRRVYHLNELSENSNVHDSIDLKYSHQLKRFRFVEKSDADKNHVNITVSN